MGKIGQPLHYFKSIDSTNLRAAAEAENGAENGTLIVADSQTAGRGRRGRSWESPAGCNLYFTLILKPEFAPEKASMLTLVMALAVAKAVAEAVAGEQGTADASHGPVDCGIKWPNDLVMNGKKICGILTEMQVKNGRIGHVLIGVGVNVKRQEFPPELAAATSIEAETGISLDRDCLLEEIMEAFEEVYRVFLKTCDLTGLQETYNAMLVNRGREVCVLDPKGEFTGVAGGINGAGELLVERSDGTVEKVYAGEVSVRGIYGYV